MMNSISLKCLVVTFSSVSNNSTVLKNVLTPKGAFWKKKKYQHGSPKYSYLKSEKVMPRAVKLL